jgi:hypothetical protein
MKHPNFKRTEKLTFKVENESGGFRISLGISPNHWVQVPVNFETEEKANRAGQAILDYSLPAPKPLPDQDAKRERTRNAKGITSERSLA